MPVVIEFKIETDFIQANVSGEYSLDSAKSTFNELAEKIVRTKITKVFIDCRQLKNLHLFKGDEFDYADSVAMSIIQTGLRVKIAFLHSPDNYFEILEFSRKIGYNLFAIIKVFKNHEEAIRWVTEK